MYDRLQLTNMLRSEVERIPETGLPLEVFPARIQELVLNLARYENFNVEYTASILLSAVATAIGNSYRIRIKGEWKTSPSIYMMLVGQAGARQDTAAWFPLQTNPRVRRPDVREVQRGVERL